MAEFLVHTRVPVSSMAAIGVRTDGMKQEVDAVLSSHHVALQTYVRPRWYF